MYIAAKVPGFVGYFVAMNRFSENPDIAITADGESISPFLQTLAQPI